VTVFGIRTGAKTESFQISGALPPGPLQALLPMKVARVESLRPGVARDLAWGNRQYSCGNWAETIEAGEGVDVLASFSSGSPALVREAKRFYLAAWPSRELAIDLAQYVLSETQVATIVLPEDVRVRRRGGITFAFNYGSDSCVAPSDASTHYVSGGPMIDSHNFSAWRK
jgi:beta-galactosidase